MVRFPEYREIVYVPTMGYIGHGEDDIRGGKAIVESVIERETPNEYNKIFVKLFHMSGTYNWTYLLENQEEWAEKYGDVWARKDPGITTEFW